MGLFTKSSPAEKLLKKIDNEDWRIFNKIQKEKSFTNKQKKILLAILTCAKLIGWGLIQNLTHSDHNLSEYIDENANPFECLLFACYIQLSDLKARIKNKKGFSEKLGENFDWIVLTISNAFEVDKDTYFYNLFKIEEDAKKENIDPRDFWGDQEMYFYNKILKKNFNLLDYIKKDFTFGLTLPMLGLNARIEATKTFDMLI